MVQTVDYKTENQIFADFVGLCQTALNYFSIENWKIRRLNQPFNVNPLEPSIFISIINSSQRGRQYCKNALVDDTITKSNYTKHEVQIRFSALRKEQASDTTDTINSIDALNLIREFMQSNDGILYLANLKWAQYRATSVTEQAFTGDSDCFEMLPFFDCTFVYTSSWTSTVGQITELNWKNIYKL